MTEDYLANVCKLGQGAATCSYIASSGGGWTCAKLNDGLARIINQRRAEDSMRAKGDNCEGDADFLTVPPLDALNRIVMATQADRENL